MPSRRPSQLDSAERRHSWRPLWSPSKALAPNAPRCCGRSRHAIAHGKSLRDPAAIKRLEPDVGAAAQCHRSFSRRYAPTRASWPTPARCHLASRLRASAPTRSRAAGPRALFAALPSFRPSFNSVDCIVLHRPIECAAHFFKSSRSTSSSRTRFRSAVSSSCSAVVSTPGLPAPESAFARSTHCRSADSVRSRSRATSGMVFPSRRTRRTASALNSGVNFRRGLRAPFLPDMDTIYASRLVSTNSGQPQDARGGCKGACL